jgi:toxin-antitoxin system PIN domain toxin
LDVNVLVALFWTNHEQHAAASAWFKRQHRSGWATCPLTETGFVRVSSNPKVFNGAPPPFKAAAILASNLKHPSHRFLPADIGLEGAVTPFGDRLSGHQQVTDAYLYGLAISTRAVLTTFDAGIAELAGGDANLLKSLLVLAG